MSHGGRGGGDMFEVIEHQEHVPVAHELADVVWCDIVPGLVAFGVDFVTGCIYLPGGSKRAGADVPATVVLDPGGLDAAAIERAVQAATGQPVDLADPALEAFAVPDASAMQQALAAAR